MQNKVREINYLKGYKPNTPLKKLILSDISLKIPTLINNKISKLT